MLIKVLRQNGQRRRQWRVTRRIKRCTVDKNTRRLFEYQFADIQRFTIDIVLTESPKKGDNGRLRW